MGEGHTRELVEAGEGHVVAVAVIALDATTERFHGQMGMTWEQTNWPDDMTVSLGNDENREIGIAGWVAVLIDAR